MRLFNHARGAYELGLRSARPSKGLRSHVYVGSKGIIIFFGRFHRVQTAVDQEIELMEALANEEEDAIPDDGAIDCSHNDFDG